MKKNMNMCLKGLVAGFLLTTTIAVQAADVAVIIHRSNPETLSVQQIKDIYSDRVTTWRSGQRIEIYNLPDNQDAAEVFAREVLGMSGRAAAAAELQRRTNNTLKNPSKTKRERLVLSIVSRTKNAIGYVPEYMVKGKKNIRVVKILKE
ncbi:MAG: substrate-binding domain-containing protein [Gammaproteobacteria bacterium]|nr:substrate-binding domain-containing protein [Gammaproteobacteria bacterium]